MPVIVSVKIHCPDHMRALRDVMVYCRVEEVTLADAPAICVAETRMREIDLDAGAILNARVSVDDSLIKERSRYNVRVHVSLSGSTNVSPGDLVSTRSHPVLTHGHTSEARVYLTRIE